MIDQLREQIKKRLDEIAAEADRLHTALSALGPDGSSTGSERTPPVRRRARTTSPRVTAPKSRGRTSARRTAARPAATRPAAARTASPARSRRSTARGATRDSVLAALAGGAAMTAGEVADKTGLGRATVSTTLSKLAGTGAVQKAQRGYRLAPGAKTTAARQRSAA